MTYVVAPEQVGIGVVTNANVSPTAAIAGTKISPNFGAQNVATTGTVTGSGGVITGAGFLSVGAVAAAAGAIRLASGVQISGRNAANSGDIQLFLTDPSDNVFVGPNSNASATYVNGPMGGVFIRTSSATRLTINATGVGLAASLPLFFGTPGSTVQSIRTGAGSPEGVITAPIGSLYTRTDGGAGTTLYVKESGTGNTGWVGK